MRSKTRRTRTNPTRYPSGIDQPTLLGIMRLWSHGLLLSMFVYQTSSRRLLPFIRRDATKPIVQSRFRHTREDPSTTPTENDDLDPDKTVQRPVWARPLRRGFSGIMSAFGFLKSATTSYQKDFWKEHEAVEALKEFLAKSGIDLEISKSLNRRLLDNLLVLSKLQKGDGPHRRESSRDDHPPSPNEIHQLCKEGRRYMKYATAVYGEAMIRAAALDLTFNFVKPEDAQAQSIGRHIGVDPQDIRVLDVDYNGDSNHLRHFLALDHKHQKLILAIRGTFSLSELVVDVAAFSAPFASGQAHAEVARSAEKIWEKVGGAVCQLLEEHPDYEFILTGHSLGAGTACLLNIMCHHNNGELVSGRKPRCFAFACPPVFTPLDFAPSAINACTNFMHEDDVVPFLSVDSIRHLFNEISVIEKYTSRMRFRQRLRLVTGYKEPPPSMISEVLEARAKRLAPKEGAPILMIPARTNIWIREIDKMGKYDAVCCDSRLLASLGIRITSNMLENHVPASYEHALHNINMTNAYESTIP